MLKQVRQSITHHLWQDYLATTPQMQLIVDSLRQKNIVPIALDHFAVIDLPSSNTGIKQLQALFSAIGYMPQGQGYLPDKQNDFMWMTEIDSAENQAINVLPQIVAADFRLEEMPPEVRSIISKYADQSPPSPLTMIQRLAQRNDISAATQLKKIILNYFAGRDWPLPTVNEFNCVREFNELLAWVLVFGRKPNHFTISVHLLNEFTDIYAFQAFIQNEVKLPLNQEGGIIKGSAKVGIEQGATIGLVQAVTLADGTVNLPTGFVEFIWRYARDTNVKPVLWQDYFTGFIPQYANHVIESLYVSE